MFVARFKDSRMPIARRKTEHATWRAAGQHEVPLDRIEVVPESQHQQDRDRLPEMPTYHFNQSRKVA